MEDDPPIQLIRRKLGCSNRLFEVFLDDLEEPGGESVSSYLVVAPRQKTAELVTGVSILPILDGRFGLLRIYRHPIREHTWEVPRGFLDPGESPLVSALRELAEETGLQCDPSDVVNLGLALPEPGVIVGRTQLYAASKCHGTVLHKASELGHRELRFFTAKELTDMAYKGVIQDANSLAVCYRYSLSGSGTLRQL